MGKGSKRRPCDEKKVAANWPFRAKKSDVGKKACNDCNDKEVKK